MMGLGRRLTILCFPPSCLDVVEGNVGDLILDGIEVHVEDSEEPFC